LQMKLRKEMDMQAEKMLGGLPVATRSEMDELYKVIYDLKKEVRQLEKMMEIDSTEVVAPEATAAKKTTTKK
jgi:polyhydroxyalkanoate synthase subunit PhaE